MPDPPRVSLANDMAGGSSRMPGINRDKSTVPCRYWYKKGHCWLGNTCEFKHG